MTRPRILVVDDEPQIHRFLRPALLASDYDVISAETGREARREAATRAPDLVVLDLGLPDQDGKEVIAELRSFTQVPIIILSARDQEQEKVEALDLGADDYVEKPFGIAELLARIRTSLRRREAGLSATPDRMVFGDLRIDSTRRAITRGGERLHLTPKEYELLLQLAQNSGRVLTHRHLLSAVWGPAHADDVQYLRVAIGQLRAKIEIDPRHPQLIVNEPAVGYRFAADREP
jgi:two-component system KDP operon response regulator KdpE